jgi:hypothetical protein
VSAVIFAEEAQVSTSTTTRDRLHELVNALADEDLPTAVQVLTALVDDDPVGLALALAPIDDEPETDEERAAVAEGKADLAAGHTLTTDELRRSLGL